jgi:hypothetical protein
VETYPEADTIVEANLRRLQALGPQGWARLQAEILRAAALSAGNPPAR